MKYILLLFLLCGVAVAHELPEQHIKFLEINYAREYQMIERIEEIKKEIEEIGCDADSLFFTYSSRPYSECGKPSDIEITYEHMIHKLKACEMDGKAREDE